jgi:heptosyltransferase-2
MSSPDLRPLRLLVIHYRYIGDTVIVVPFFRNLRAAYPNARIVWALGPGDGDVVKGIPYVDEVKLWDPGKKNRNRSAPHRTWRAKLAFIRELRRPRFDKCYILKRSVASALLGFASGARERIGFNTEWRRPLLTQGVAYRRDQHEVENLLDVLRADGISPADKRLELWVAPAEQAAAADFLSRHGAAPGDKFVALHPFATNEPRAWHEDDFAEVAAALQKNHGARAIIFGGKPDRAKAERLRAKIGGAALNIAGETDLRTSMALLARCALLIGNDSGIMHLAAALGVPLVALFGPGTPDRFGPLTDRARVIYHRFPCSPCRQKYFRDCTPSARQKPPCLEAISVAQVLGAVEALRVFAPETG